MPSEILSRQEATEKISPASHVAAVVSSGHDIDQVTVIIAGIGGGGDEFGSIAVSRNRAVRIKEGVHIVREIKDAAVGLADVELDVVLRKIASVAIAATRESIYSSTAEPLVHIDHVCDLRGVRRAAQFQNLAESDNAAVIISILVVLDQKIPTVSFFVVAEI